MDDPDSELAFEREKWKAEVRFREREIAAKEREAEAKLVELRQSRWRNPIFLAILAAAIAGAANVYVAYKNGEIEHAIEIDKATAINKLEDEKATADRDLEENKAEAARILEVVKTNDPDKAATNLEFLLNTGLIRGFEQRRSIQLYLERRKPGEGIAISSYRNAMDQLGVSLVGCPVRPGRDASSTLSDLVKALDTRGGGSININTAPDEMQITLSDKIVGAGGAFSRPLTIHIADDSGKPMLKFGDTIYVRISPPMRPATQIQDTVVIENKGAKPSEWVPAVVLDTLRSIVREGACEELFSGGDIIDDYLGVSDPRRPTPLQ